MTVTDRSTAERETLPSRFFRLRERATRPRTEVIAGISMLLAAAYSAVVVPAQLTDAGVPGGAITTVVAIAIVLATLGMGLVANLPFVIAPRLGGVALVAVTIVGQDNVPWPTALGMVFWSGVAFLLLSAFGIREFITRLIPPNVKRAISAGVGLFIALVGFRNAGLVVAHGRHLHRGGRSSCPYVPARCAGRAAPRSSGRNRYGGDGLVFAPVAGRDLSDGAVAMTYAHDSHNLVTIATSTPALGAAPHTWGWTHPKVFMSISTLSLAVSPALKVTDLSLVDVRARAPVSSVVQEA